MRQPACPSRDQLTSYVLGKLDDRQADLISDHLGECPDCRTAELQVESVRDDLLDSLRRPAPGTEYLSEPAWMGLKPRLGRLGEAASSLILSTAGDVSVSAARRSLTVQGTIGRYEIQAELGRGGMGVVYQAFDPKLKRAVAIKLPFFDAARPDLASVKERFLREMEAAAKVEHVNVCPVYDTGELDGAPYAVLKFLDGGSLADRLRKGLMPIRQAVEMARKIALGLREIHRVGIVHRDLKPGNVLLDRDGEPAVSDFGLARQETDANRLTPDGAGVGTPAYVAPEQAEGHEKGVPTMDVYSLGVILYEMLTGKLPFTGSILEILRRANEEDRPRPSLLRREIDAALEAIVLKAMARRPERRYQTAREFLAALDGWLTTEGTQDFVPSPSPEFVIATLPPSTEVIPAAQVKARGNWWLLLPAAAGALLFAVVLTASLFWLMRPRGGDRHEAEAERVPISEPAEVPIVKEERKAAPPKKDKGRPTVPKQERPLPPAALVMRPAKIDGVRSWTIAPRKPAQVGNHRSIAWSPEGKKLAVSGWTDDSFCTVRSATSGAVELRIDKVKFAFGSNPWCRERGAVYLALVQTGNGKLAIYDADGVFARVIPGLKGAVQMFNPGRYGGGFAVADNAKAFAYRHVAAGERDEAPLVFDDDVTAVVWSPQDSTNVAIRLEGGEVAVFHSVFQREITPKRYHAGRLIAWSPSGNQLATQTASNDLVLRHPITGEEQMTLAGHKGKVTSASWATEKGRLVSADEHGSLRHWNLQTGNPIGTHSLPHAAAPWLFSPDGQTLVCCANNAVYFASGRDGSPLGASMLLDDEKKFVAITADGHYAGSPGIEDDLVFVVETDGGKEELSPADFAKKYRWKNDPKRVKFLER